MSQQDGFWAQIKKAAGNSPRQYFAPLTWGIAWITGVLTGRSRSVPSFRDWLYGIRHITPADGNIFLDLGHSPKRAAELQLEAYRMTVCKLQNELSGSYAFILNEEQIAEFEAWKEEQDRKVVELQKNSMANFGEQTAGGTQPYYGSGRGGYTFSFIPATAKTFVIVSNSVTKAKLYLTKDS